MMGALFYYMNLVCSPTCPFSLTSTRTIRRLGAVPFLSWYASITLASKQEHEGRLPGMYLQQLSCIRASLRSIDGNLCVIVTPAPWHVIAGSSRLWSI